MTAMGKLWGSRVPGWALTVSAKGYHALMAMVAADLKSRGLDFDFGDAAVTVERDGRRTAIELPPLVDACSGKQRGEWAGVGTSHLDAVLPK